MGMRWTETVTGTGTEEQSLEQWKGQRNKDRYRYKVIHRQRGRWVGEDEGE